MVALTTGMLQPAKKQKQGVEIIYDRYSYQIKHHISAVEINPKRVQWLGQWINTLQT